MVTSTSRRTPPGTIVAAFFGFLVSTVVAFVGAGVIASARERVVEAVRAGNPRMTDEQVRHAATLGQGITIVIAVLVGLFFLWLAFKLKAGRNWARVVLTVVTAVEVASLFVAQGGSVAGYAGCAVSVLALVLSYLPSSDAYIKQTG
jgi:hypothetical protein